MAHKPLAQVTATLMDDGSVQMIWLGTADHAREILEAFAKVKWTADGDAVLDALKDREKNGH